MRRRLPPHLINNDPTENEIARKTRIKGKSKLNKHWILLTAVLITTLFIIIRVQSYCTELENKIKIQEYRIASSKNITTYKKGEKADVTGISTKPIVLLECPNNISVKHFEHVLLAFERLGYEVTTNTASKWDILWAHNQPFFYYDNEIQNLEPHQKVNKLPGMEIMTSKVAFSIFGGHGVPPSFTLPHGKQQFLDYIKANPEARFLEKGNLHRSVKLKDIKDVDFETKSSFLQKFISNPLLINGRMFDIGVHIVVTSIEPLRIYRLIDDVTFRFCKEPYHPFNPSNLAQYVIGQTYTPYYKIPELKRYLDLSLPAKEAFDAYLESIGKEPKSVWDQVDDLVRSAFLSRLEFLRLRVSKYKNPRNFFEMVRFDFILDDQMKLHAIEVNMSPSLSSVDHPPNGKRYEQIVYNTLSIIGLTNYLHPPFDGITEAKEMLVADRSVMLPQQSCLTCKFCGEPECELCALCLTNNMLTSIKDAYREHMNKYRSVRVFPPRMSQEEAKSGIPKEYASLSKKNELMYRWFQGRCLLDINWC